MRYLSLFSGIGGFELGIQQAYVESINRNQNIVGQKDTEENVKKRKRLVSTERKDVGDEGRQYGKLLNWSDDKRTPHCVGFSEIDKYATQIYQKHFPNHKNYGDITKIKEKELPDFYLLVGGFPCQSFSIAGKRRGFEDTRGTLFFDIARILKQKQPRLLLLENVKGLLNHDQGRTFRTIISTLDELGYDLQWQVLNSKNFGVPQNRERVFIAGHSRGTPRPEVFPIGAGNQVNPKQDAQGNDVAHTLQCGDKHRGSYVRADEQGTQQGRNQSDSSNVIRRATYSDDMRIRRLTPTECARLQGFPDDWHKVEGISDTQAYKCYGNAVSVPVVKAIVKKLL